MAFKAPTARAGALPFWADDIVGPQIGSFSLLEALENMSI
jgi:hypothetical protein